MVTSNPLIKRDRRKKRAAKTSKVMRRIVPVFTAALLVMCSLVTFASAEMTAEEKTFFNNAFLVLQIVIIIIGGGLALWGIVNLLEGYGNDNPGAKSQGMKQLMAGAGVILIGAILVPALRDLFINESDRTAEVEIEQE